MKNIAPRTPRQHPPAEERRQHGSKPVNHHHDAHELGGCQPLGGICNDRAGEHRSDSAAEAHEETRRNEDLNAGRESAQCGRNKADYRTDQKRLAAAGFIGERADHKLPERHAYHEGTEGHRGGGIGGVELAGNRRQRSQVHVDTQRSDSGQRGKGDDNGGRNTEGNFNVIRVLMTLLRGSL